MVEAHLFESTCAFTQTAIVVTKNFNTSCRQIPRPTDPGVIRKMPFRCKWPHQQHAGHWIRYFMQHRIESRAGDGEVSGAFQGRAIAMNLSLQRIGPSLEII